MKIKTESDRARSDGCWSGFWIGVIITTLLWLACFGIAEWIGRY